jgi:hypothetical protein
MVAGLAVGAGAMAGPAATTLALSSEASPTTATPADAAKPAATTTSVAPTLTTRATPAAPTNTVLPVTTVAIKSNDRAFCEAAQKYLAQVQRLSLSLSDRARVRVLLNGLPAEDQLADSAPAETRADVTVLSEVLVRFASTLSDVDYDLARLPPDVVMSVHGPAFTTAMSRLNAWTQRAC